LITQSEGSLSGGQIAGATIGSVAGAVVVLLGFFRYKRRTNRRSHHAGDGSNLDGYQDYAGGVVNRKTARLSKFNFLTQMLGPDPSQLNISNPDVHNNDVEDPWRREDQQMTSNERKPYGYI
jgi:hypothetical protein